VDDFELQEEESSSDDEEELQEKEELEQGGPGENGYESDDLPTGTGRVGCTAFGA
jgi:hypothetical protein